MEDYLPVIIQLFSGAIGGNLAGAILKKYSLGTMWNSIVGILGGGLGGTVLGLLGLEGTEAAAASSGLDLGSIVGSIAGGGVGGGILMAIVGLIRKTMNR
ncbi:MAG: hypothetical protein KJO25_07170 [Bacteroidia bacterium]|nr:hypothetical protein [Bacteroidia bacterium]